MPDPRRVAIIGGKGHGTLAAQTVLNLARATGGVAFAGYLNDRMPAGSPLYGGPVLCTFDDWRTLDPEIHFVAPLYKAGHMQANSARIDELGIPDSRWAILIDPSAILADGVPLGRGTIVAPSSTICPDAVIGNHCSIRPGAVVSHDVVIGDFVYVGPSAAISGNCRIGTGAHIGVGATMRDQITIGPFAVVGAGAVVIRDVPAHAVVVGNPARVQQKSG